MTTLLPSPEYRAIAEQGFGDWTEDLLYVMQRLRNPTAAGEASAVVPRLTGFVRVPYARGFTVVASTEYLGGTQFVLGWIDPEDTTQIDRFNIYAINLLDENREPILVGSSTRSPCVAHVISNAEGVVIFKIQTVLKNGYANDLAFAPSCTGVTAPPALSGSELGDGSVPVSKIANGTPGELITWSAAGVVTTAAAGAAGTILKGAGAAPPAFGTPYSLGIVQYVISNKTSDFSVTSAANVYLVDATSTDVVASLPAASGFSVPLVVKKTDSSVHTVTLDANGSDTIDGAGTFALTIQYESIYLIPTSGVWNVVSLSV